MLRKSGSSSNIKLPIPPHPHQIPSNKHINTQQKQYYRQNKQNSSYINQNQNRRNLTGQKQRSISNQKISLANYERQHQALQNRDGNQGVGLEYVNANLNPGLYGNHRREVYPQNRVYGQGQIHGVYGGVFNPPSPTKRQPVLSQQKMIAKPLPPNYLPPKQKNNYVNNMALPPQSNQINRLQFPVQTSPTKKQAQQNMILLPPPPPPPSSIKHQIKSNNILPPPPPLLNLPPPPPISAAYKNQLQSQINAQKSAQSNFILPPPPPPPSMKNLPNSQKRIKTNHQILPPPSLSNIRPQTKRKQTFHQPSSMHQQNSLHLPQTDQKQKQYPIKLKKDQINQSQRDRIRNLKVSVENSDKIKQDGTIPIKLVLVGDGSVGKTSMLISYTTDGFPTQYVPTIFDNYVADIKLGPKKVKLWLWDTAGQQQYAQLRLISYQKADIFFICFSMIDQNSFQNALNKWFPQVQQQSPKAIKIFVGTKSDLHQQYLCDGQNTHKAIPVDYIKKKCQARKCIFMPSSGLNQKGLSQVFNKAMTMIIERVEKKKKQQSSLCQMI